MVRFAVGEAISEAKKKMMAVANDVLKEKEFARVQLIFDVDPQ